MKFIRLAAQGASDADGMIARIREPHCFEVSAVLDIAEAIWAIDAEALTATAFLPAPQTWIEFRGTDGVRMALFADKEADGAVSLFRAYEGKCGFMGTFRERDGNLNVSAGYGFEHGALTAMMLFTFLAIINTPRLVGRKQHEPNKALVRELRRAPDGELTLHPWSEIKLEITPRESSDDQTLPASVTGRKCLHFCRSHFRVQNGRLVVVRPHWRGDAALGVKQSDYRVAA